MIPNSFRQSEYLQFLNAHKYRIALTYLLTVAAAVSQFAYPYVIGLAIDGALSRNFASLFPLIAVWAVHLVIDGFRQVYDTRTFSRVFADASTRMVVQQKTSQTTGEIAARVNMMEELTWFLGGSLPDLLISIITPIGSLVVLFLLSWQVGICSLVLSMFALALSYFIFPKLTEKQKAQNSLQEQNVSIIDQDSSDKIQEHYTRLSKAFIEVSDLNAATWVSVQFFAIPVVVAAIWIIGSTPNISSGEAYTIISYVWRVLDGVIVIPGFAQQFARLADIWHRISIGQVNEQ